MVCEVKSATKVLPRLLTPSDIAVWRPNNIYLKNIDIVNNDCSELSFFLIFSERDLAFTFAICHRPSVVCLSVCNVRAPYSGD